MKPTKRYFGADAVAAKTDARQDDGRKDKSGMNESKSGTEDRLMLLPDDSDSKQTSKKRSKVPNMRKIDPYPGEAPVSEDTVKKYTKTKKVKSAGIKGKYHEHRYKQQVQATRLAATQAARAELLLREDTGYFEADEGEDTSKISQYDIADAVDITSAEKFFELHLDKFGPYRINYTRNGRHLLVGGRKGHLAAIDWQTKHLMCEFNATEVIEDVKWLHTENMFAVAQKKWTYVYDNQGLELHCLKLLDSVLRMEYLPYHFLLATSSAKGYLSWLDISVGKQVSGCVTHMGRLDVMCQNPHNAIIHLGATGGSVTLWSPSVKEPLIKMLCHRSAIRGLAVDTTGNYMATAGVDRSLRVFDLRTYKPLYKYKISAGATCLNFSQTGLLAAGLGNVVEVYKDCHKSQVTAPYMSHRLTSPMTNLQFCPYEDVVGVGHGQGFASLIIPGAGEANFDALDVNPYQTKKQRQEWEVKALLDKIQPELITLNPHEIGQIDQPAMQSKLDARSKLLLIKSPKSDFEPKHKKKGKSKTGRVESRKKGRRFEEKREFIKDTVKLRKTAAVEESQSSEPAQPKTTLDRFKSAPQTGSRVT
ncbi:PREDICTED: WD repeat-containing protein 46-like [Priapulus caudatus]|uniref:WD repeat-containing protein 46-like n=1 Tax=Priapulus caudatus TaxID=37621 RepID=A0ABM1E8S3_PRICU|nr:PREDICTED: WD repeat-containing protein 46-like [Priapulus caudatus]